MRQFVHKARPARCFLFGLLFVGVLPPAAATDTAASEVLRKCTDALGGEAAWQAIDSLEMTGMWTSFSTTRPLVLRRKRPDLYRLDISEFDKSLTLAFDGTTSWWRTEAPIISKATWPVETPKQHTRAVRLDAEFEMPVLFARQKRHRVRYFGETRFEGERFLELEITRQDGITPEGSVERWFLDPESFLPALRVSEGTYHGYYTEQRQHFSDYREVAGVRIPFRLETEVGNDFLEAEIDSVRVNIEIEDTVFRRPLPTGMEAIQALTGRWQVVLLNRDNPGFHAERPPQWETHTTEAVISSRHAGSLLFEEIEITTDRPRRMTRYFTYDRFRDLYRIACFDTFTNHLDILEGRMEEDGRIVVSNLETGTASDIYGTRLSVREILFDLSENAFRLDREVSKDGGHTWRPDLRSTYTRRVTNEHVPRP